MFNILHVRNINNSPYDNDSNISYAELSFVTLTIHVYCEDYERQLCEGDCQNSTQELSSLLHGLAGSGRGHDPLDDHLAVAQGEELNHVGDDHSPYRVADRDVWAESVVNIKETHSGIMKRYMQYILKIKVLNTDRRWREGHVY